MTIPGGNVDSDQRWNVLDQRGTGRAGCLAWLRGRIKAIRWKDGFAQISPSTQIKRFTHHKASEFILDQIVKRQLRVIQEHI